MLFGNDLRYRRFLARHPGLWNEVGAFDDKAFLRKLRADRRALGLPADPWQAPTSTPLRIEERAR